MDPNKVCVKCMRESVSGGVCAQCGTPAGIRQTPPHALPLRTILHGRYFVGLALGHGGFGITYAALDLETGRRVAIKEFLPEGLSERSPGESYVRYSTDSGDFLYGREQFLNEAQIIYTLRGSRSIIEVEKLFEEFGTAYYAMEYLDGSDLRKYLAAHGDRLTLSETVTLLEPVFDALSLVHRKGIIHRDVSPDNIFICRDGTIKLIDFGAAHAALGERSSSFEVILKRGYAPIEQYMTKGRQGPWTDVYALAGTVYRCITGKVPCEATDRVNRDVLKPPSALGANITRSQEAVLLKAMAVNQRDRYASADEFRRALAAALGRPVPPVSAPLSEAVSYGTASTAPGAPGAAGAASAPTPVWKRICAALIDYSILGVIFGILYSTELSDGAAVLISACAWVALNALMESGASGASIGKSIMKLRVSAPEGGEISMGAAVLRNALKVLLLPLIVVDGAAALLDDRQRSLHCRLSSTVVTGDAPMPKSAFDERAAICAKGLNGVYAGSVIELGTQPVFLGRDAEKCNIVFPAGTRGVSGLHCSLRMDADGNVLIRDEGSRFGTALSDGSRLSSGQMRRLSPGDRFIIGDEVFLITNG